MSKSRAEIEAELAELETRRGAIQRELAAVVESQSANSKAMRREFFDGLTPVAQDAHIKDGGWVID